MKHRFARAWFLVVGHSIPALQVIAQECKICSYPNSTLKTTPIPSANPPHPFPRTAGFFSSKNKNRDSCSDWQSHAESLPADSPDCFSLQHRLSRSCCTGLPPQYQCQKTLRNDLLLFSDNNNNDRSSGFYYDSRICPIDAFGTGSIDVALDMDVSGVSIANYGVDGGAIETTGTVRLAWRDEQLRWNPARVGCTEFRVGVSGNPRASDIWFPLTMRDENFAKGGRATVLADGSVSWSGRFRLEAGCETVGEDWSKLCSASFASTTTEALWDDSDINYVLNDSSKNTDGVNNGVALKDARFSVPGYVINENLSGLSSNGKKGGGLVLTVLLEPLVSNCPLCGGIAGAALLNDTVPLSTLGQSWLLGVNCRDLDAYFSTVPANNSTCAWGRTRFAHQCCTGLPVSQNTCESNLHDRLRDNVRNTVTPPDPDPGRGEEMLPVNVALDLTHVLDIDMRANTVEIMASLELIWTDGRLRWDPFIGGCTVVSLRAGFDPEQTEIWVPEVGLLNQVEGTEGLSNAHATVFHDGVVWWKRSGTLKAACDLKGIRMFPFDRSTGNFDFGNARDPLVHRVTVVPWNVEYSDRIRNQSAAYQEYQVDWNLTEIDLVSEDMSGYTNNVIRFQFYFSRAVNYYMWMFVVLYIVFTYMSFGMLFLDQNVGERLGYGTGILFVIVAQDITMSEYTPVTQELLWIYEVSFASKVFVILGIIESVFVLYLYFLNNVDGDDDASLFGDEEAPPALLPVVVGDGSRSKSANPKKKKNDKETNRGATKKNRSNHVFGKCWVLKKLFKYMPDPTDSRLKQKMKRLRLIDRSVAIAFLSVYTMFLVSMFVLAKS